MKRVGIRELRADLSNQVKRAAAGESVVVTIDGEPKVVITQFVPDHDEPTLEDLIRTGRVIPGPRVDQPRPPRPEPVEGGRPMAEVLEELREERI